MARDELEIPGAADQLYRARGEEVNQHRPYLQGDVFDATLIPGLPDEPGLAMVTTHACSMRGSDGVALGDYLHVARVIEADDTAPFIVWFPGSYDEMPLPDLLGEGAGSYAAQFDLIGRTPVANLGTRVATLDDYGIAILQQRLTHNLTRVAISVDTYQERNEGVLAETELMEEWIEGAHEAGLEAGDEAREFHAFLREPQGAEPLLQDQLGDKAQQSHARQVVREEIKKRFTDT